ncbi:MAG: 16S rRNA (cytosine(967)-C(5))-methyltransferase RsmB [Defluviitaleaceae bacterium]|nr:16S rRNA (cytosine(967)-C(5))-methyltransferase RsmB [Defluviitaleaceae bacterium]
MNQRVVAINALMKIMEGGGYNNIVLRRTFNDIPHLVPNQRAFVTDIVNGTLRNLLHVDYIINLFSKTKITKMEPLVLYTLRIAIYEIFHKSTEQYAICNEAVNIVKAKHKHLAPFVNGVLRSVIRNKTDIIYPTDKHERLSVLYSMPMWIIEHLAGNLTQAEIEQFCKASASPPVVSVAVNTLLTTQEQLIQDLESEGVEAKHGIRENNLIITKTKDISNLTSFKQGHFHIIDPMSMTAVDILAPKPGATLYDVCAAPGGKSFYAAYIMKNKGEIFATDIHMHKIGLIEKNAARLEINIINAKLANAEVLANDGADYVLLDVPCSGLGTLSKKPDIKYTKDIHAIKEITKIQKELLKFSAKYAKIGGYMLYSTCTLSYDENQGNIAWFLQNYDYKLMQESQYINTEYTDGFYIALLKRRS